MRTQIALIAVVSLAGCAHRQLSGRELDRVARPAFISRIEEGGGPRATVFRDDSSYNKKLGRLDRREADRRLEVKLRKGITRFEVAERLRATTLSLLPRERPWTNAVDPVDVARELQSFLVEEVPANPPDYELLRPLGADVIVEFVVEEFGMRSDDGRAGPYIEGYGRMFRLDGKELWFRRFRSDAVKAELPHVDPFRVAREPHRFRAEMGTLIDAVAQQFAQDLSPTDRGGSPPEGPAGPDDTNRTGKEPPPSDELPPPSDDLPPPD